MSTLLPLIVFAAFVALVVCFTLGMLYAENRELRRRVKVFEDAQAKRLPYKSQEAIEDFLGSMITTTQAFEIAKLHLEKTQQFAKVARNPEGVK